MDAKGVRQLALQAACDALPAGTQLALEQSASHAWHEAFDSKNSSEDDMGYFFVTFTIAMMTRGKAHLGIIEQWGGGIVE